MNSTDKNDPGALSEQDLEQISGGAKTNGLVPCICGDCRKTMMGVVGAYCPYCGKGKLFPA